MAPASSPNPYSGAYGPYFRMPSTPRDRLREDSPSIAPASSRNPYSGACGTYCRVPANPPNGLPDDLPIMASTKPSRYPIETCSYLPHHPTASYEPARYPREAYSPPSRDSTLSRANPLPGTGFEADHHKRVISWCYDAESVTRWDSRIEPEMRSRDLTGSATRSHNLAEPATRWHRRDAIHDTSSSPIHAGSSYAPARKQTPLPSITEMLAEREVGEENVARTHNNSLGTFTSPSIPNHMSTQTRLPNVAGMLAGCEQGEENAVWTHSHSLSTLNSPYTPNNISGQPRRLARLLRASERERSSRNRIMDLGPIDRDGENDGENFPDSRPVSQPRRPTSMSIDSILNKPGSEALKSKKRKRSMDENEQFEADMLWRRRAGKPLLLPNIDTVVKFLPYVPACDVLVEFREIRW